MLIATLVALAGSTVGAVKTAEAAAGDPAPWLVDELGDSIGTPNAVEHVTAGDRLFFTRSTPSTGVELWTLGRHRGRDAARQGHRAGVG